MGLGVIYMITNKINNKKYIGQTIQKPRVRFLYHIQYAAKDRNIINMPITKAIHQYGKENFDFEVLEECEEELLDEREEYYVNKYDTFYNGYNATLGGQSGSKIDIDLDEMLELYHKFRSARQVAEYYGVDKVAICERLKKLNVPFYKKNEQSNYRVSVFKEGQLVAEFECKIDCAKWLIENKIGNSSNLEWMRRVVKTRKNYYGYDIIVNNKI